MNSRISNGADLHHGTTDAGWTRRSLWAFPLLTAVLFVAGVLAWSYRTEKADADERRATLISDALSSEAQLRALLDGEAALAQELAQTLPTLERSTAALARQAQVTRGLRGLWLSVTWLDANNRIVAHVPDRVPKTESAADPSREGAGLSSHFVVTAGAERLVVRYAPTTLLRRGIPWWLARKYDVQLVDSSEQVIASVDEVPLRPDAVGHASYRLLVGSQMPGAYLELTARQAQAPTWAALPLLLSSGFLLMMAVVTSLLRRQMHRISRAESAWRTEAAWRHAMGESALVGLRARDAQGRILYVNRTFCHMVGMDAQELVGLCPPMPYWPPDTMEAVTQRNQRNLAGLAPREGYETEWLHRSGRRLHVMVFESPLIDAQGQQIGWMGSIIDITARKALEERERHQTDAMAHQARLTTLGEIASALAHQLNQPLTAVMGYNAGLQRLLEQEDTPRAKMLAALQSQQLQASEAGHIVQRIREFLTRRAPKREACNLVQLAQRALGLLHRELQQRKITVGWNLSDTMPEVYADVILVEQVLLNLVRNAADALDAQTDARRIGIAIHASGTGFLKVDVEDNGGGLEGRTVEQLSAPFYSTKSNGMGMGLAICRSVIEAHHGGFDAGASAMGGARFSFTLPVFAPKGGE